MTPCLTRRTLAAVCGLLLTAVQNSAANGLQVTNVTVRKRDETTAYLTFDVSWKNSWRYTNVNHDAAWVFFKARQEDRASGTAFCWKVRGSIPRVFKRRGHGGPHVRRTAWTVRAARGGRFGRTRLTNVHRCGHRVRKCDKTSHQMQSLAK
jgi:hypothetical protein